MTEGNETFNSIKIEKEEVMKWDGKNIVMRKYESYSINLIPSKRKIKYTFPWMKVIKFIIEFAPFLLPYYTR